MNLADVIERECRKATMHAPYYVGVSTLSAGRKKTDAHRKLRVNRQLGGKYTVHLLDSIAKSESTVDIGRAYGIASAISHNAFAKTQYTKVEDDPAYQRLYDVRQRDFTYVQDGIEITRSALGAPCMVCGLMLPMRNMTVDHQRPQTGGQDEAVLKTFRAFGLTTEGPKGSKGKAMLAHLTEGVPLATSTPEYGREVVITGSVNDRYTLNLTGAVIYSFVVAANLTSELASQCMHGLLNLRPSCGACNSARGQSLKFDID